MFRCQSLLWVIFIWTLFFSYTFMTHLEIDHRARSGALGATILAIITVCSILIYKKVTKRTKTLLWIASWVISIITGLILFTEHIISDTLFILWVTAMSALASIFWCIVSHSDKITEAGLHWYIWSLTTVITICCAFNITSSPAVVVYIANCTVLSLINIAYIAYIYKNQPSNWSRCRQIWQVCSCFVMSTVLLIGVLLLKTEIIDQNGWSEYIMFVQALVLIMVIVDTIIEVTRTEQTYTELEQEP